MAGFKGTYSSKQKEEIMSNYPIMDLRSTDILCYHKVHRKGQPATGFEEDGLSLDETEFERHLMYLKAQYNILNLENSDEEGKGFKKKLILTFDDGTRDIVEVILPIIEKHNIPIVIFITTSLVEDNSASCWFIDLWENIKERSELRIKIRQELMVFNTETILQKNTSFREIHRILFQMNRQEQMEFFAANNLKTNYNKYFLNKGDLVRLADHHLVTLGFHSHYHLNYKIENLAVIENDIDKMLSFFKVNNIAPNRRMFAFCYGISSQIFLDSALANRFDLYFTLGFKSMILNKRLSVISRIDVSGLTLNQLKVKLKLLRVIRFVLNIFKGEKGE